jgi:hypothetical protein
MSPIDSLPADQQAVLALLLKRGKSYDELAVLLRIDRAVVEDRARAALDTLGPDDVGDLSEARRCEITDYLLGQQSPPEEKATRELLETSAPARAWARVLHGELRGLGGDSLPDVPVAGRPVAPEVLDAFQGRRPARDEPRRGSKAGGVVVIAVIAAVIVGLILLIGGGGGDKSSDTTATTPTTTSTQPAGGAPQVEAQINLRPAHERSGALGVVNIVSQGNQRALAVVAQGLPPSPRYAVWLNGPKGAKFLGFAPPVTSNGRLQGLASVPSDIAQYSEIIVTREKVNEPKRPGTIVLRGALKRA